MLLLAAMMREFADGYAPLALHLFLCGCWSAARWKRPAASWLLLQRHYQCCTLSRLSLYGRLLMLEAVGWPVRTGVVRGYIQAGWLWLQTQAGPNQTMPEALCTALRY